MQFLKPPHPSAARASTSSLHFVSRQRAIDSGQWLLIVRITYTSSFWTPRINKASLERQYLHRDRLELPREGRDLGNEGDPTINIGVYT